MLKDAGPVGVHDFVAHEAFDVTSIAARLAAADRCGWCSVAQ
jgi:hypothetical protein